ncbi:Uma2 family endonuclease [Gloeobacter morelensis]|uniref:Uma2 family endonuclease n=1 Tax=Gloeobacter morelensis MG652769 TaxID=2781736 RepID=A0ABY3PR34_9CYAN|nr:Uma2 family endonuclease [Gloeobacter morelensis]UFP96178.1 Uma2 family endonuclease [Gloeobacter morelensis MG652769]
MVLSPETIIYPDSDGRPMADNTEQFRWIVYIKEGLEWLFAGAPNVFVAGDLLWYPAEGNPRLCQAPDALVAFGRPKGKRGSYRQWQEAGVPPQVVFEVLSPGNGVSEMTRKFQFYQRHGVEEYYIYDPEGGTLDGFVREGAALLGIDPIQGWVSPRLGVRFELGERGELCLWRPDGMPFESYAEIAARAEHAEQRAEQERQRAEHAEQRAEQEQQRAEQERQRAEHAEQQTQRLAQRLRELGIDPQA